MTKRATFAAAFLAAFLTAEPASAGPVAAAISAIQAFAASSAVAAFVVRIGISLAMSALSMALQSKKRQRAPGIKTDTTTTGGTNPQTFILGRYATAGNMAAPPYSHPNSGDVPNKWLTYVVDVSDMPGVELSRVMLGGEWLDDLVPADPAESHDYKGKFADGAAYFWMNWHDGHQTAADAYMLEHYGSHPDRPWKADMVGTGIAYAVMTFVYNRKLFTSLPGVRLEVLGLPLYDPRKDGSVPGGTGLQRWDDPATWERSDNPAVMIYNILRGITLPDGRRWGGKVKADCLPLDNWFAAMNECDVEVTLKGGGSEPQYRAGLEVSVSDEPSQVVLELLNACSGSIVEMGGIYKLRVGPPALPVYFFTDADVLADMPENLAPYPGLEGRHNAIHVSYPEPESLWENRDAPPRYNAEWEAQDGGRQLVAEISLPPVYSGTQAQRLGQAWIEDERRFRRHSLSLPPDAAVLEPLDTASWNSAKEGYSAKVFELGELTDDLVTCIQTVALREREAGDFTWVPGTDEQTQDNPSTAVTLPAPRTVPGFGAVPHQIRDGDETARRPAVRLFWSAASLADGEVLRWRLQLADGTPVAAALAEGADGEVIVSDGILPQTEYRAQARIKSRTGGTWTAWVLLTTGDERLTAGDLSDQINQQINEAESNANQALADAGIASTAAQGASDNLAALLQGYTEPTLQGGLDKINADVQQHGIKLGSRTAGGDVKELFLNDENWVPSWGHTDANRANHVTPSGNWADVSLVPAGGENALRFDGVYRVISERFLREGKAGQRWRFTVRMRYTTLPTTPVARLWIVGSNDAGVYVGYSTVKDWYPSSFNGASWVNLTFDFTPADAAIFAANGATKWGIMFSPMGGGSGTADGVAEVSEIRAVDLTTAAAVQANLEITNTTVADNHTALVAQQTEMQAGMDGIAADLATNYYAKGGVNDAITLAETRMTAEIDTARALDMVTDFTDDGKFWGDSPGGTPAPAGVDGAQTALSSVWQFYTNPSKNRVAHINYNKITGTHWLMSRGGFKPVIGRKYKIVASMMYWGTVTSGTPKANLFFRKNDPDWVYINDEIPGNAVFNISANAYTLRESAVVECTASNAAAFWRPGLYVRGNDFSMSSGSVLVQSLEVFDVTDAVNLGGEITDMKAMEIDALTGTAMGTFFDKVEVSAQRGDSVLVSRYFDPAWATWSNAATVKANEQHPFGKTLHWPATGTTDYGYYIDSHDAEWTGAENPDAFFIEVEFEHVSGDSSGNGCGILLDWRNTGGTNYRTQKTFKQMAPGEVIKAGRIHRLSGYFKKPDNFSGTFSYNRVYIMANFSGLGTKANKNVKIHSVNIRPASGAEASVEAQG